MKSETLSYAVIGIYKCKAGVIAANLLALSVTLEKQLSKGKIYAQVGQGISYNIQLSVAVLESQR